MKSSIRVILILVFYISVPVLSLADGIIKDVYQIPLTTYDESGKKTGEITDKANLIDKNTGTATSRRLVPVELGTNTVWIRAGQLKLSLEQLAECPESAPGRAEDLTSPVSSGMGAECKNKGE